MAQAKKRTRRENTHDPKKAAREFDRSMTLVEKWYDEMLDDLDKDWIESAIYALGEAQYFLGCADGHLQYASTRDIPKQLLKRYKLFQRLRKQWTGDLVDALDLHDLD